MSNRILVTGGTGHIGWNLVRLLRARGEPVRLLARPSSPTAALEGLGVELRRGSLLSPADVGAAMAGCGRVFHLASPTRIERGVERAIVDGTRTVLEAASSAGVERLVYTSSIATVGYSDRPDRILDEDDRLFVPASAYHQGKLAAEAVVLQAARTGRIDAVVVNPSTVVGPGDLRGTPSTQPLRAAMRTGLRFWFDSGLTIAHSESVAVGHWLAMERGRRGERYILGGERLTIREYFGLANEEVGRPPPRTKIPLGALLAAGAVMSVLQAAGFSRVPFDLRRARAFVGKYGFYSSRKAEAELGYEPRDARAAIRDFLAWLRASGARAG